MTSGPTSRRFLWSLDAPASGLVQLTRLLGRVAALALAHCAAPAAPGAAGPVPTSPTATEPALPSSVAPAAPELELLRALPLQTIDDFQPSGLSLFQGRLLTVSDRHDSDVFELLLGSDRVTLRSFAHFPPPGDEPPPLDFEGLSADAGALLLVSERHFRVLRVQLEAPEQGRAPGAAKARWLTESLETRGHEAGLFQKQNANFEGLVRLSSGALLLAAEREPRGLMQLDRDLSATSGGTWAMPNTAYAVPAERVADFCDLAVAGDRIYALVRNAHLIVELQQTPHGFREGAAWSYAAAENAPEFAYADPRFGLAEGLAIGEREIFVVLDNNAQARRAFADDRRPLLFVFKRPPEL